MTLLFIGGCSHDLSPHIRDLLLASISYPRGNASRVDALGELVVQAGIISLHVPASADTRCQVGDRLLARMKPTAILEYP